VTALLDHLDVVRAARKKGMQSERFISELHDTMRKVSALLPKKPNDFLDADYILTETIVGYEKHPILLCAALAKSGMHSSAIGGLQPLSLACLRRRAERPAGRAKKCASSIPAR
jgi:hypothetical protein